MLKILPAPQIRALDSYTIEHTPITSIDLMERACRAFTKWLKERFDNTHVVGVVCGTGNNGGDGLGIARMLSESGYAVKVWVIRGSVAESHDFKVNLERVQQHNISIKQCDDKTPGLAIDGCDVVVDAIFGSGLSRPASGIYATAIEAINDSDGSKIAVDIPSGLMADSHSVDPMVRADFTVSFQLPKLSFFLPECYPFVGKWSLVNIGLDKNFLRQTNATYFYLTRKDPGKILKQRSTFGHKGNFGHALLVAGSLGKIGAAVLAARSSMRSGLGLLTVHVPRCGYSILQTAVPEAMVSVDDHEHYLTGLGSLDGYTTLAIGPGLGRAQKTAAALGTILQDFGKPVVIDADGLNILAENRELLQLIPRGSILTPHPGEFERLVGKWSDDFEKLALLKKLAIDTRSVIILKGAYSSIASPDGNVYFNPTGNPGMATGGSGDVLTGVLVGLVAQGYEPLQACLLGVYLHGLSGDIAALDTGIDSLIASDLVDYLPSAFQSVRKN
jgi:NAD(P)H-hydrate epimerase